MPGCFYEYKFRAKPGAKYRYRFSTDVYTPEWGHFPNEEKGRLIRYGQLLNKGTVRMPMADTDDDNDGWGMLGGASSDGAVGALLLDCDGTLAETERDGHRVAFNKAFEEKGFDVEWDVDLYGDLLTTGGGKERMTRYFKEVNPDAWSFADEPSPDNPVIMELHELKTQIFMDIVSRLKWRVCLSVCLCLYTAMFVTVADHTHTYIYIYIYTYIWYLPSDPPVLV